MVVLPCSDVDCVDGFIRIWYANICLHSKIWRKAQVVTATAVYYALPSLHSILAALHKYIRREMLASGALQLTLAWEFCPLSAPHLCVPVEMPGIWGFLHAKHMLYHWALAQPWLLFYMPWKLLYMLQAQHFCLLEWCYITLWEQQHHKNEI